MTKYELRKETYKKRYAILRELGYSPEEARKLRSRKLDVDSIKIDSKGTVIKDTEFKEVLKSHDRHYTQAKTYKIKGRPLNEVYKIRYQMYRDMGYTPSEARKMRSRRLDVAEVSFDSTGRVRKDNTYMEIKRSHPEGFREFFNETKNKSIHSKWGMFTSVGYGVDHNTQNAIEFIMLDLGCTSTQAYYFLHFMVNNNMTYEETKEELLTSENWEVYRNK